MKPKYSKSHKYKDFRVDRVIPLDEINCILYDISHTPTGAHVLHIQADDPENVFCLSFRTYPYSDDGVAHILEHTVLCGSEQFPVKDPFFSMNRRSLNTFMNAFTSSDYLSGIFGTCQRAFRKLVWRMRFEQLPYQRLPDVRQLTLALA